MTGTAVDRGRRAPDDERGGAWRRSQPVVGAPGWRVVERQRRPLAPPAPGLAPVRSSRRGNPLLPWAAGALLSMVVLGLTVVDQSWLDEVAGRGPAVPESAVVVRPIENAVRPATETEAVAAPPTEAAPGASPRVVPISPEGRGTARVGVSPQSPEAGAGGAAPAQRKAPQPVEGLRIVPISLERPEPATVPAMQLVGGDGGRTADLLRLGPDAPLGVSEAADSDATRLYIHYTAARAEDAATARRLADYLDRRGFEVAAIRPVEIRISSADVRYFFERDLPQSRRLVEDLGWFFRGTPEQAPPTASDFTDYSPKPRPGNIEIWLPAAS